MSNKFFQKTTILFLTILIVLCIPCNKNTFCMEPEENKTPHPSMRRIDIDASFEDWKKTLLDINTSWSKVLLEKCPQQHISELTWCKDEGKKPEEVKLEAEGAQFLANGTLSNLTKLLLSHNNIGVVGVSFLAKGNLINLTTLYLYENGIGDDGVEALSNGNLSSLTKLDLGGNKITIRGAKALSNGTLFNLTKLFLLGNEIGDDGAEALSTANFTNLEYMNLKNNNIGIAGKKALQNKFGTSVCKFR